MFIECPVLRSLVLLILFSTGAEGGVVNGKVLADSGIPVPNALVRLRGTETTAKTNTKGEFAIKADPNAESTLTAWKEGFYIGGAKLQPADKTVIITIKSIPSADSKTYKWASPEPPTILQKISIGFWRFFSFLSGNEKSKSRFESNCSNCHAKTTVPQWSKSAHAVSAQNPVLRGMYEGVDTNGKKGVFPGYKLDFPNSAGNCAACHAPIQWLQNPWNADIGKTGRGSSDGITCDFCHKIRDAEPADGGHPGALSIRHNRPPTGEQLFYGPFDDVSAGPDTFSPLLKKSRFCAPCHSGSFWGTQAYSEYDEWLKSPYPSKGVECQDCHMAPDGESVYIVPPEKGGVRRDAKTIATHFIPGARDVKFIRDAMVLEVSSMIKKGDLEVTVLLKNEKAGHHVPTGVPMRNMLLLVEAYDKDGNRLGFINGPTVPAWGGKGDEKNGNYAGLPGKGFAKILRDVQVEPDKYIADNNTPAPHWRRTTIISDTRIPAGATDVSRYHFKIVGNGEGANCGKMTVRLMYRRTFKSWSDAKGWNLGDMEIWRKNGGYCK